MAFFFFFPKPPIILSSKQKDETQSQLNTSEPDEQYSN